MSERGSETTIEIRSLPPEATRLWAKVLELAEALGREEPWALIGGLMVQLHGFERGRAVRPTADLDLLGDSRRRPAMTERITEILVERGGEIEIPSVSNEKRGYRFTLEGEVVQVLGSEGVRGDPRTTGSHVTVQVPGGTQALRRAEVVQVSLEGAPAIPVRRPSLLGAILLKARAVAVKRPDKFASDREDLIRLLSLVDDPRTLAGTGGLSSREAQWLRTVELLLKFERPAPNGVFSPGDFVAAEQAFRLLIVHGSALRNGKVRQHVVEQVAAVV